MQRATSAGAADRSQNELHCATNTEVLITPKNMTCVQEARRRVQGALTGSTTEEEPKGAFTTVAEAVMSAGNAIGQFSTQMLGGGEVSVSAAN